MLDALTLDQMRIFIAIADSGSFRAAAKRLSRVQSGVSVAIANLEAQLGIALFDRAGHRPVLTAQGRALLGNARDIIDRVDILRATARGFADGVETELSIAVDTLYPLQPVGSAVSQVRRKFPSVSIKIRVEALGGPLDALRQKRCALAVMVGEDFRDPRIRFDALTSVAQAAVVAASHPIGQVERSKPLEALELADHLQIVLSDPSAISADRDFGVISPQTCRVNTQDAKYNLILAGVGWGRLPLWLVERDIELGRLVRLNVGALGRNGEITSEAYIARRLDESLGPAARAFTDILVSMRADGT